MKKRSNKLKILTAAVAVCERDGYMRLTRENIANVAGVSDGSINYAYETMTQLKRSVMRYAVSHEILSIIAAGLVIKHPAAMKADKELKEKALATLV